MPPIFVVERRAPPSAMRDGGSHPVVIAAGDRLGRRQSQGGPG
jgi:hypothetical protein